MLQSIHEIVQTYGDWASLGGLWIGLIALWATYRQAYQARKASEAASMAVAEALTGARLHYKSEKVRSCVVHYTLVKESLRNGSHVLALERLERLREHLGVLVASHYLDGRQIKRAEGLLRDITLSISALSTLSQRGGERRSPYEFDNDLRNIEPLGALITEIQVELEGTVYENK
ncbi:MAG: hypothetical protein RLY93_15660 [Sumerlaeia bacterium]